MAIHSQEIYTGIEIGTATIKVAICSVAGDYSVTLLGWGEAPSIKVIKGEVKDRDFVCQQLTRAVKQAETEAQVPISETFVTLSVGGRFVSLVRTEGTVSFETGNMQITEEHIIAAERQAVFVPKDDSQLVDCQYTRYYRLNKDEILLAPPVGSYSSYIQVQNESIVFQRRYLEAYASIAADVIEGPPDAVAYTPLALAFAAFQRKSGNTPSEGFLIIDIGAGVTSYALHTGRDFFTMGQITVGCDHAANDLSIAFCLPINSARKILRDFGNLQCSVMPEADGRHRYIAAEMEINGSMQNIPAARVEQIVQLRFQELFNIINKKIKDEDAWQWATGGVMICGGGARIPKIQELASTVFNRPVAIAHTANAKGREDIVDSPVALVPLGLARFGKQSYDIENQNHPHDTAGRFRNFIKTMLNW
ncbi:MAG: rod shape-determining protein [Victivallales bacterium]|nr:rod shape-determining protein [Victivallales bacterium]